MRGEIRGLETRVPLAGLLPSILQADPFARRWVEGLDEVLAPIIMTLDCLDAYIDPNLAPADFLEWLGSWVGTDVPEDLPLPERRRATAEAATLSARRGTVAALTVVLELELGVEVVSVRDGGGVIWTLDPTTPMPDEGPPSVHVVLRADESVLPRARRLARAWTPAHLPVTVEVEAP